MILWKNTYDILRDVIVDDDFKYVSISNIQ